MLEPTGSRAGFCSLTSSQSWLLWGFRAWSGATLFLWMLQSSLSIELRHTSPGSACDPGHPPGDTCPALGVSWAAFLRARGSRESCVEVGICPLAALPWALRGWGKGEKQGLPNPLLPGLEDLLGESGPAP